MEVHAEAAGLWSVIFFYATVLVGTILHSYCQHQSGAAERDEDATRRHAEAHADGGPDAVVPCLLVVYFFSFSAGCLLWAAAGVRWVHPVQSGPVQLAGAALLLTCTLLFVATHMSMGENWSPQPEVKVQHQLVTRGVFRWARHPMYAVFLWASIGTLLATLNWLIAWCVFWLCAGHVSPHRDGGAHPDGALRQPMAGISPARPRPRPAMVLLGL